MRERLVKGVAWACIGALGLAVGLTDHPTGGLKVAGLVLGIASLGLVIVAVARVRDVGVAGVISAARVWVLLASIVGAALLAADLLRLLA